MARITINKVFGYAMGALLLIAVVFFIKDKLLTATLPTDVLALRNKPLPAYPESIRFQERYGHVETLEGTSNQVWISYYPKGDFTIVSCKGDNPTVLAVHPGRQPDRIRRRPACE